MSKLKTFLSKKMRLFGLAVVTPAVSILLVLAVLPPTGERLKVTVYPDAITHEARPESTFAGEKNGKGFCYHTQDPVAKVLKFYENQGFSVTKTFAPLSCCLPKESYLLSRETPGKELLLSVENFWFDEQTGDLMRDTLISISTPVSHRQPGIKMAVLRFFEFLKDNFSSHAAADQEPFCNL
jgi:hypothetical protein